MKLTTLSSAAIVAALTLGALAPTAAMAAPTELESTGTVTVQEGGDEPIGPVVPPEQPAPEIIKPGPETTNPNLGPLMIERTSNLNFGTIKTSANEVTAYAAAVSTDMDNPNAPTIGNYVQWRDIRAGGTYGYTVTAEMTQQFTGAGSTVLSGSTIDFSNGLLSTTAENTNAIPSNVATAFQLTEASGAQTVVTANQANREGKGTYILGFGQSSTATNGTAGTDGNSVKLTVPAATASNMAVDTYTAKVTWKVVAAQ
ncbi:WxL domain-containing protein [Enterococcus wangshanyuanii]|uniref:Cell surface protein n=1 Tax=Enterococcus wangshanyuanii TaxID=2005703 RepID=A0ABQ1P467_9ENTE|nr:WxL domain-containing protein [Enterococcus wangshanyuanii]GGC90795.1 cell surface protein [Enterococcus wangshanyuanii]